MLSGLGIDDGAGQTYGCWRKKRQKPLDRTVHSSIGGNPAVRLGAVSKPRHMERYHHRMTLGPGEEGEKQNWPRKVQGVDGERRTKTEVTGAENRVKEEYDLCWKFFGETENRQRQYSLSCHNKPVLGPANTPNLHRPAWEAVQPCQRHLILHGWVHADNSGAVRGSAFPLSFIRFLATQSSR